MAALFNFKIFCIFKVSTAVLCFQTVANTKHCTLNTLPEGCIGKLQLLKSGRTRLVLGNIVLCVDMGTQVGFREVSIEVTFKVKFYILMIL